MSRDGIVLSSIYLNVYSNQRLLLFGELMCDIHLSDEVIGSITYSNNISLIYSHAL